MKIKIFVRHCNSSSNSVGKSRPEWFSRKKCWDNLLTTSDKDTDITVMFDGEPNEEHFLYNDTRNYILVKKYGGNDGQSFLNLVEYVYEQNIDDDTILYFVEDDFYHKPEWTDIMREGFEYIGVDYMTLYDHADKYFLPMYESLQSKIIATPSIHWRTTPSTTNTYAMLAKTFKKHYNIHVEYCDLVKGYTRDHDKFIKLWEIGSNLVSCIPGYSTHCETEYLSPCIKWNKI
jgi:glycosyltransferase involved in cell wall biosynthesis